MYTEVEKSTKQYPLGGLFLLNFFFCIFHFVNVIVNRFCEVRLLLLPMFVMEQMKKKPDCDPGLNLMKTFY